MSMQLLAAGHRSGHSGLMVLAALIAIAVVVTIVLHLTRRRRGRG